MRGLGSEAIVEAGEERAGRKADRASVWVRALEILVASAADGGMTDNGLRTFVGKLEELVEERLRAEALFEGHPEIARRPLPVRFAVAGMGRSGTTLLQRLLSCDPDVAFLPTWQAMHPVPESTGRPVDEDPRRQGVVAFIEELARTNPEALRIHPLDADAPEEEVFLLQHSFASMLFSLSCPLPTYSEWLAAEDNGDAYRFALDLLRLNEWASGQEPGRPRVMKSPQFLLDLAVVRRLAPEAVVAQTHRDPVDLVGSYCSTYASSRRRSVADLDLAALGQERLAFLGLMAERAVAVRDADRSDRFVDVHYVTLVRDPFSVVEQLYERAGVPLRSDVRKAMEQWLAAHPQHQAGRHDYNLGDYSLDRSVVETLFGPYIDRFSVESDSDAR